MAPTSRRSSSTSAENVTSKQKKPSTEAAPVQDQWVFIANEQIIDQDENASPESEPTFCKLRHPRTDTGVCYLTSSSGAIFELQCFDEKFHSWFIGESIQSNGQIYLTSQTDPLFLVLPYLINAGKKERFMSLDQIVCDEDFPSCERLLHCVMAEQLALVADVKEIGDDDRFYRYSKSKTLDWLKAKVENVAEVLETKNVDVGTKGAHSAIFVQSKTAKASKESYLQYAVGLVSDNISVELEEHLKEHLGMQTEPETPKQDVCEEGPPAKKARISTDVAPIEDYSTGVELKAKSQSVKLTAAQKKLSKVDKTGMKSISSFFGVKN